MIVASKVLLSSATVAMLAAPAVVSDAADVVHGVARVVGVYAPAPEPSPVPMPPHCAAGCDLWAALARTR